MKNWSVLIACLAISFQAFCQDTTKILYTEAYDSLPPLRFIDRYENIFMNKVPTKNIFKLGVSQYQQAAPFALYNEHGFKNSALQLSYEHKLSSQFSAAVFGQMPLVGNAIPVNWILDNIAVGAQFRWYYDMKSRISSGRSANNFTGNYMALEYSRIVADYSPDRFGLRTGFQRRFLNNGFLDLSIGLRKDNPLTNGNLFNNWNLFTEISLGVALGDWKRVAKPSYCELVRCDQQENQHFKLRIPDIKFGKPQKALGASVAYEVALGQSPVSVNIQYDLSLQKAVSYLRGYFYGDMHNGWYAKFTNSKESIHTFSIQPRYYLNQKRQLRHGKAVSGLSGIYAGINTELVLYSGTHRKLLEWDSHVMAPMPEYTFKVRSQNFRAGALLGIQQRLFKHGYVDLNTSCNYETQPMNWYVRMRANLTVGFAFGG